MGGNVSPSFICFDRQSDLPGAPKAPLHTTPAYLLGSGSCSYLGCACRSTCRVDTKSAEQNFSKAGINFVPPWPLPHFSLPFGFKVERSGIQHHMACSTTLYAHRHVVPRYVGNLKLRVMAFAFLMCLITRQLAGNENQRDRKRVLTHARMRQITIPSYWRSGTLQIPFIYDDEGFLSPAAHIGPDGPAETRSRNNRDRPRGNPGSWSFP